MEESLTRLPPPVLRLHKIEELDDFSNKGKPNEHGYQLKAATCKVCSNLSRTTIKKPDTDA
jgi:hypothetical protein